MKELHQHSYGPQASSEMAYTHELGNAAFAYIQILKKMFMVPMHYHQVIHETQEALCFTSGQEPCP